jgi:hypothetical protein
MRKRELGDGSVPLRLTRWHGSPDHRRCTTDDST